MPPTLLNWTRLREEVVPHAKNGAEAFLELLPTNSTVCIFALPIAAPLWETLSAVASGRSALLNIFVTMR